MYLQILDLPGVELRCKLQEKLHRVTGAYTIKKYPACFAGLKAISRNKKLKSESNRAFIK